MAIVLRMYAPGGTAEQYERVNEIMGVTSDHAPEGLIQHIAAKDEGGILIVDVWESEEKLDQFFESGLGRAIAEAGMETTEPEILELHAMIPRGRGTQPNVIMEIRVDRGPEVYDELVTRMPTHVGDGSGHPVYSHVAAVTKDGGIYVVDLWESPEAFGRFAAEELGPAAGDSLGEIQPSFTPVHNVIHGNAPVPA